ncbi:hemerythrin domain-containing protein [Chloroflexota bacterium]
MEDLLILIDEILNEHKTIQQRIKNLEDIANDAEAIAGFEKASEDFKPGRFDQSQGLKKLRKMLNKISRGLEAHFNHEETNLLSAFKRYGAPDLASNLGFILLEHEDIRNRLEHAKQYMTELNTGGLSRHLWEASANDMRAHLSQTRRLIEVHVETERKLLQTLRKQLKNSQK